MIKLSRSVLRRQKTVIVDDSRGRAWQRSVGKIVAVRRSVTGMKPLGCCRDFVLLAVQLQ